MRIISYNVNGIRAAIAKGFLSWLQQANPDIICLQEIKATEDQIPLLDVELSGYPYHYWFPAQKKGYSGVAVLSKVKPNQVVFGTGIDYMDFEGRNLRLDFDNFSVMSLYLPSGTNIDRLDHKFQYMDDFYTYVNHLKKEIPNLIICGDYNICHEAIDIHDPVRNKTVSGFLPEERAWLDKFIKNGFIDTFRFFNKEPHHYSWWSYRANARANNKGWRIDYCLATETLKDRLTRAVILPEAKHSDHCPVLVEID
ncbi:MULTISPECIES: exodeoxyribonuclease III [Flavobacterium]|uniref:Exodeoxyribonuclease III n=1 Tax=Flavobacterium sedimenticola TaxID=3043286 RepID=A0ABT6XME6_9FLAO|nr:exodeoxyribonuclease III [Flavobacterium sedimenticola]MDI9256268.1 exodeoxyribonuclease III [Flavobacterium sedimenticola]